MSYDVSIGKQNFNYTFNLSALFYTHFPGDDGLSCLDGKRGKEASKLISAFWESLQNECFSLWRGGTIGEPRLCAKYDSPNGWGSLVGAMLFVAEIGSACAESPRKVVRVYK